MLSDGRAEMGALNLDIIPGDAQVYVDGEYVGLASSFDGLKYLWLPKGTHDIVFYKEGFETLALQETISPGLVITLDFRLEPGPSVRPDIG